MKTLLTLNFNFKWTKKKKLKMNFRFAIKIRCDGSFHNYWSRPFFNTSESNNVTAKKKSAKWHERAER